MIKLSTKFLALIVAILVAINMAGSPIVFAQHQNDIIPTLHEMHKRSSDYKIERIRSYLKSGNIEIPEDVIQRLEAIILETVVVEYNGRNERGRIHRMWRDKHSLYDPDFSSPILYEKYIRRLRQEKRDYFASQTYKKLKRQRKELREQALNLFAPYFESISAPKPQFYSSFEPVDTSNLTVEEQVKHRVENFKRIHKGYGFPISEKDLRSLEAPIRELIPLGRRSKALTRDKVAQDSPEFEQLRIEVREARKPMFQILKPYMDKYQAQKSAYKAKQSILFWLNPFPMRGDLVSPEELLDRDFKTAVKRYSRYDIMISGGDKQGLKSLMSDKALLLEEMEVIRFGWGLDYDPNSIEVFNLKSSLAKIEERLQNILKQYDEDLEIAKKN